MSRVINARLDEGQYPELGGHVTWLVERKIRQLEEAGDSYQAHQLKELLECANYPVGYY
jgi:hypothetical protein